MNCPDAPRPTTAGERIVVLDALRGFALFGILFVNMTWFTGYAVLSPEQRQALGTAGIDGVVSWLIQFLVNNKFWSLFALLFGIGAAVQYDRAKTRGDAFERLFARRVAVLLFIGLLHAVFIWFGDIISLYAVAGFAILLFRRWSGRAILICAAVCLVAPIVQGGVWLAIDQMVRDPSAARVDPGYGPGELLVYFGSGTYAEAFKANWAFLTERWYLAIYEGRFFKLLGMFLLGFWAGRKGVLHDSDQRSLLRRVLLWGLLLGVPANAILVKLAGDVALRPPSAAGWLVSSLAAVGVPALCLAYAAGFALLCHSPIGRRCTAIFVHAGRMTLTNYIVQSIIGVTIFYGYGFGLWGRFGTAWSLAVIGLIFGIQAVCSAWWLRMFRYGPLEWVWRCLTYGQRLRLRRDQASLPAGARGSIQT